VAQGGPGLSRERGTGERMEDRILEVKDLSKEYPSPAGGLRVLDSLSFGVGSGESLAVVGPSGSGKSTLLNLLGALDRPTTGEIVFDGEAVHVLEGDRAAAFRNRKAGFVFQDHHLLPQLTATENVLLPRLAEGAAGAKDLDRAAHLLGEVGLAEKATRFPVELSGGERARVALARALMNSPKLILCDEPTGNLDAENSRAVAGLLHSIRKKTGAALVVATHDRELAATCGGTLSLRGAPRVR